MDRWNDSSILRESGVISSNQARMTLGPYLLSTISCAFSATCLFMLDAESNIENMSVHDQCCRMCHHLGSDLTLGGCGCSFHAQCIPVHIIVAKTTVVQPNTVICPGCNAAIVKGFKMLPMTMDLLDRAVQIRKANKEAKENSMTKVAMSSGQNNPDNVISEERSYLFGASGSTMLSSRNDSHRTGRWTEEETDFVDFLVHAFDAGTLPLAAGVRLNDFLCSVLMCKTSRLTKKMKNAKLGMRVYEIKADSGISSLDCKTFIALQERFLQSIGDDATSLELRFVMCKTWRQNIYNLCLQVGYANVDVSAWLQSLDALDRRAAEADEKMRQARRLKFSCGKQAAEKRTKLSIPDNSFPLYDQKRFSINSCRSSERKSHSNYLHTDEQQRSSVFDNCNLSDCCPAPVADANSKQMCSGNGSLLDDVLRYMQVYSLPFEFIDVWVPSVALGSEKKMEDIRLLEAGHAITHKVLDPLLFFKLQEFGQHSSPIALSPGEGFPGRVFSLGRPVWQRRVDEAVRNVFERAHSSKTCGIKTAVGIPLYGGSVDRADCIVLCMYSVFDLKEDLTNIQKWAQDLSHLWPQLKWKLEVEANRFLDRHATWDPLLPKPLPLNDGHYIQKEWFVATNEKIITPVLDDSNLEAHIAMLLESYFLASSTDGKVSPAEQSGESSCVTSLHFLLNLPNEFRSSEEEELIKVILESYRDYCKNCSRSQSDIIPLLVRDWHYLNNLDVPSRAVEPGAMTPSHCQTIDLDLYRDCALDFCLSDASRDILSYL